MWAQLGHNSYVELGLLHGANGVAKSGSEFMHKLQHNGWPLAAASREKSWKRSVRQYFIHGDGVVFGNIKMLYVCFE